MHYGFSVLFVVTFSSPHFIPPHWHRGWNRDKAWKNGRKATKNFSYPWFWQFQLVKSRVFCFLLFFLFSSACWALSEEGIVGKRVPLPHNPRFVLSKTSCCFTENDVLFCWKRRVVLLKLTCCFIETDVLFYWNWRVVFNKGGEAEKSFALK